MPKILFVSTIAIFSRFNRPFMRWFRQQGWQVDYTSDGEVEILDCDNQYTIPIKRTPYNPKNIKAYKELKSILSHNYDIVHCDTPMGGVLGRLAARKYNSKVIYTAHGFHFYKGAPFINWMLYYPIEKYLAKFADVIITINDEDFYRAKNKFTKCHFIEKIDGVGVDLNRFRPNISSERNQLRNEFGYRLDEFLIANVAEINKNKNQLMLVKALPALKKYIPNIKVLFIGTDNYPSVKVMVNKLGLQSSVNFLGYRNDVDKLMAISDIGFSASFREGLPINIVEAMACGIPIVCSKNRGHNSLIHDEVSGLLFSVNNKKEMINKIISIHKDHSLAERLGAEALKQSEKYSLDIAVEKMAVIYKRFM